MKKNKAKTQHNMSWTTEGKDEPNHRFYAEIVTDITTRNKYIMDNVLD
jgi:hypothetical protein